MTRASAQVKVIEIPTARVFVPLLGPSRYKGAHGGRGSGKSHFFGEKLIDDSQYERGLLSVCIREVQKSIRDSAKRLMEKKLSDLRLGEADGFKVFRDAIQTPGDGVIAFTGMQDHTAESIKSLEGFRRAWWDEAQRASAKSLMLLRPTIRAPGSELWFSWNPRRKIDPVDVLLRGAMLPTDATVVEANWRDNPWFTPELEQELQDCLRTEPDQYPHIWEGDYLSVATGAYYAKHLIAARAEGRISVVAADPLMTIFAIWDIGGTGQKADAAAIWIVQFIGLQIRILNYYEAQGQPLAVHVQWLRDQGYASAHCILPHDGDTNDRVHDVSYASALRDAGFEVEVIPNQGAGAAMQRVEAARRLFPNMWFDAEKCAGGIEAIGWYHEKKDEARNIGLGPEHDWSSHGADAFGLIAVRYEAPKAKRDDTDNPWRRRNRVGGWMR